MALFLEAGEVGSEDLWELMRIINHSEPKANLATSLDHLVNDPHGIGAPGRLPADGVWRDERAEGNDDQSNEA